MLTLRATTVLLMSLSLTQVACTTPPQREEAPATEVTARPQVNATPAEAAAPPPAPTESPAPAIVAAPVLVDEDNVFFTIRSVTISAADKAKLQRHAERLKNAPQMTVTLEGHTDELGSRSYNLALTEERLTAVVAKLRSFGVPARQIRRNRVGSVKKGVTCKAAECRQKMRRVQLVYSP